MKKTLLLAFAFLLLFSSNAQQSYNFQFDEAESVEKNYVEVPVLLSSPPTQGTFFSAQMTQPPWPFLPFPELNLDVYSFSGGFIYDDRKLDYPALKEQGISLFGTTVDVKTSGNQILEADGPTPPGEGGSEEGPTPNPPLAFDYTNGLWLSIYSYDSNWMTLTLHGTIADGYYEILTKTNLSETNWTVDQGFIGQDISTLANSIWLPGRTNLFFWARYTSLDTDGDGLPDWWEMEHGLNSNLADTGNTGTPDGYKDADGDGWTNLDEMRNGTNPNQFNTPLAPVSLKLHPTNSAITLTWNKSAGPVTGYLIQRADPWTYTFNTIATVNSNTTSYTDTGNFTFGDPDPGHEVPTFDPQSSVYRIRASYAGGSSQYFDSQINAGDLEFSVDTQLVRGSNGHWEIVCSAIPNSITKLRFYWFEWGYWWDFGDLRSSFDISVTNFSSGVYQIPDSEITNHFEGDLLWVQGVGVDGQVGVPVYVGKIPQDAPCFVDGREHVKQNLLFQLRAATLTQAISLSDTGILLGGWWGTYGIGSSTNYVESSFFHNAIEDKEYSNQGDSLRHYIKLDDLWPFKANYQLHNALFDPSNSVPSSFEWRTNFLTVPAPAVLGLPPPYWIAQDFGNLGEVAAGVSGDSLFLQSGAHNLYGLGFGTALVRPGGRDWFTDEPYPPITLSPGSSVAYSNATVFFSQTAFPSLQTVDYFFSTVDTPGTDPINGEGDVPRFPTPLTEGFNTTNQTAVMIASVGRSSVIGGWAKQAITNGYANKFAYLGQYFDKAYQVTTNGVVTTNSAGILSPYGEFFPTQAGQAALVTMPDMDTGLRGTAVVHVVKIQLDVDHDGEMNPSFYGPDNTFVQKPFVFWINNDNDGSGVGTDINAPKAPDYSYGRIRSQRNLEDFARLWVSGLPALPSSQGYTVTLRMSPSSGNPAINLYRAYDTNGGAAYLSDTNAAAAQFTQVFLNGQLIIDYAQKVGSVDSGHTYTLPVSTDGTPQFTHFLFEGAGIGSGDLVLTISQGTNVIAQTSASIDLKDVKDLCERVIITNSFSGAISNWSSGIQSVQSPPVLGGEQDTNLIALVHGINVRHDDWVSSSATVFKRLYWAGYRGKFATVKWPCDYLTPPSIWDLV